MSVQHAVKENHHVLSPVVQAPPTHRRKACVHKITSSQETNAPIISGLQGVMQRSQRAGLSLTFLEGAIETALEPALSSHAHEHHILFLLKGQAIVPQSGTHNSASQNISAHGVHIAHNTVVHTPPSKDGIAFRFLPSAEMQAIIIHMNAEQLHLPLESSPQEEFKTIGISPAMAIRLQTLFKLRTASGLRALQRESLTLELLSMVLALDGSFCNEACPYSCQEKEQFHRARVLCEKDLASPPSLATLARASGLNECKLKKGFKALFSKTVYGYVTEQRMELAKQHLLEGDMNVNEAGWAVGYSNVSHFIAAFRKQFGISPGAFKRDARSLHAID